MERFQFADELTKPVKSALAVSACHALCHLYQDKHLRKYACHTKCEGVYAHVFIQELDRYLHAAVYEVLRMHHT